MWQDYLDSGVPKIQGLEVIVKIFLNNAVRLAGLIVFIMLLAGGFQYLTSGANPEKTKAAKNTLTYAVLGLVLMLLSWLVLLFIREFTGIDVIEFIIPR